MRPKSKTVLSLFLLSFLWLSIPNQVWADFSLSVTPREGGGNLNFGCVNTSIAFNREVQIKITSTGGIQYQVFQRVIEPLKNEKGNNLSNDVVSSYIIRGSNTSGTLYLENEMPLSYADQLLYISSLNGESDSFRLIYKANKDKIDSSGNFSGKIMYTVQPIGAGTQKIFFLNVYMQTTGEFKVEIESSSFNNNLLTLSTERDKDQQGYLKLFFQNNPGDKLEIYQEVIELPKDELNNEIEDGVIDFYLSGNAKGEIFDKSLRTLEKEQILIYSSDVEEDELYINFQLNEKKLKSQRVGVYRGDVNYIIESFGTKKILTLTLEIDIKPIFELKVIPPPGGMNFNNITPTSPAVIKEVGLEVITNLGKSYIVTQNSRSLLLNDKGQSISKNLFTMEGELFKGCSGIVKIKNFVPVSLDNIVLFFSDEKGSSSQLRIRYKLQPDYSIAAGEYSAMFIYSLEQK